MNENFENDVYDEICYWYRRTYQASYEDWLELQKDTEVFKKVCSAYWDDYFRER